MNLTDEERAEAETIYLVWDNWPNHAHPQGVRGGSVARTA